MFTTLIPCGVVVFCRRERQQQWGPPLVVLLQGAPPDRAAAHVAGGRLPPRLRALHQAQLSLHRHHRAAPTSQPGAAAAAAVRRFASALQSLRGTWCSCRGCGGAFELDSRGQDERHAGCAFLCCGGDAALIMCMQMELGACCRKSDEGEGSCLGGMKNVIGVYQAQPST